GRGVYVRTFLVVLLIVLVVIGAAVVYLMVTTPKESAGIRFPLSPAQRALLASVPASAESFALIPNAASLEAKLRANLVTREAVDDYRQRATLPSPWMLGGADVVVWRSGKATTYFVRLDAVRSLLAHIYLMVAGDAGPTRLLINTSLNDESPIPAAEIDQLLALGGSLPAGEALVVQREESRGAYPPIGRPSVSTVTITPASIDISSVAPAIVPAVQPTAGLPAPHRFARNAILTANFTSAPRLIEESNRLLGAKASVLLRDGGAVVLYSVDSGRLLPRPREVVVIPNTPERRALLDQLLKLQVAFPVQTAEAGNELLVAFDDDSIAKYKADTFDTPTLAGNRWSIRIDPQKALPTLEQVSDNTGLRLIAPRLFRSARDLNDWIEHLKAARSVEAAASTTAAGEELRVRIAAK
ncbi:MAG TPA: hypothetical protein VGR95_15115, partial [Thermoanaerobaculia bacterium]|nr:hypothetical protein [Thermoanaerobaculia bacterium]